MNYKDLMEIAIYIILAGFGAAARELKTQKINNIEIASLVSSMVVAAFGSTIFYFIACISELQYQAGYIFAGFIGWGGSEAIDKIFEKWKIEK